MTDTQAYPDTSANTATAVTGGAPPPARVIDFMRFRKIAAMISIALVVISLLSLLIRQLELGVDFTGGTLVEVAYEDSVSLDPLRQGLRDTGFESVSVQHFGQATDVLIRIPPDSDKAEAIAQQQTDGNNKEQASAQAAAQRTELGKAVVEALRLQPDMPPLQLKRIEFVGPQVGAELRDQSGLAMLVALGAMLIYITLRFQFKFAIGAVLALFHDVILVLGAFSILGFQFDLTVLAAVLAVIGYSLNDTIVVSDRVRENFKTLREGASDYIVNLSLSQTLGRTLITSLTTLLVLLALLVFGGEMISGFATALLIGVVVGTYSSIYVASNVLLSMHISREDFLEPVVEELDDMP